MSQRKISAASLSATSKISGKQIPMEHVSFKNVSFKETLTIGNDSIVSITNSTFGKSLSIYVRDNSQLTLKNISVKYSLAIMVSDNATLNIRDSKVPEYINFFIDGQTKVYIENCRLDNSVIEIFDSSKVHLNNVTIHEVYAWGNSTIQAFNITGHGSWFLYKNDSAVISHAKIEEPISFYETSSGSLYNVTLIGSSSDIYLYDNSTIKVNNSKLNNIYVNTFPTMDYFAKAEIYNSTFDYMTSHSECMSILINVTGNEVNHGWVINGVGNMTNGKILMEPGYNLNENIKVFNSKIKTITENTYIRVEGYEFNFYNNSWLSRVHAYDSKITVKNTTFYDFILDNSSVTMFDSTVNNQFYLRTSNASLNQTPINTGYIYSSEIMATNNTDFNYIYPANSNLFFVSSIFIQLDSKNSTINLENTTETTVGKTYDLTDSEITFKNDAISSLTLTADPSTVIVDNSSFDNCVFYLYNSSASSSDSIFGSSPWYIYENSELSDINSTLYEVHVYGPNSHLSLQNEIIQGIFYETDANSTGLIKNVQISSLYSVQSGYFEKTSNRITIENSTISSLYYSVSVLSGTVNINNHRVSGTGAYQSSVELDSKTNFTTGRLVYLYVEGGTLMIQNTTYVDWIDVKNAEFTAKNVTANEIYLANTQYAIRNVTFDYLGLGFNWTKIEYDIFHGRFTTYPSNGTISNSNILIIFSCGGEAWITNVTIYELYEVFSKIHLENSTIDFLLETFYFTSDGNITSDVPYGYSDRGIIWGSNNIVLDNYTNAVIYNGTVTIYDSMVFFVFTYNNSKVFLNESDTFLVFIYNSSNFFSNSSYIYVLSMLDNSHSVINSTEIEYLFAANSSIAVINESYIHGYYGEELLLIEGNANVTIVNSGVDASGAEWMVSIGDNAELKIVDSYLTVKYIDVVFTVNDSAKVFLNNVTFDITDTDYGFELRNNSQLLILESNITNSFNLGIGCFYDGSKTIVNNTMILGEPVYNWFVMSNNSVLEAYNTSIFSAGLQDLSNAYLYDSNVLSICAMGSSHFEVASTYFYNSSTLIYESDYATGSMVNHSLRLVEMEDYAELILLNVYANYTGPDTGIYMGNQYKLTGDQVKLTAQNLTAAAIYTYFEFNRTDMGYLNITDSNIGYVEEKVSLYHYGSAKINGTIYSYDSTVDLFNHTTLRNTNVTEREYALNIGEFVDATVENASFTYVKIARLIDTAAPIVSVSPETTALEKGMLVADMEWNVTEDHPDIYVLKRNGTIIKTDTYKSGKAVKLNISALDTGFWVFEFTAMDRAGYSTTVFSNITVYPSEPPVFVSKPPRTYKMAVGSSGNVLNWTATDRFPANYKIYVDGELKDTGTWTSDVKIEYNVDGLAKGNHTVRIVLYDLAGNSAEDIVSVLVKTGISWIYIILIAGVVGAAIVALIIYIKKRRR